MLGRLFGRLGIVGVFSVWFFVCLSLAVAVIVGYVANIVQLVPALAIAWSDWTPMLAFKTAGVLFPPLGVVLGYIGFFA